MVINSFKRIRDYFEDFTTLKAANLDSQFNIIGDYLNKSVLPILNSLVMDSVPGSRNPADSGKFLQNVGDGTTRWSRLGSSSFADSGLSLLKLSKADAGGTLCSGVDGKITTVVPSDDNQVLNYADNVLQWEFLNADNFEDRTITGDKVANGSLTNENLPPALLGTQLLDNSITGVKFVDGAVTTEKLATTDEDKLTFEKLSPQLQQDFAVKIFSSQIPDNFLTRQSDYIRAFRYSSLAEFTRVFGENTVYPVSKFAPAKFEHTSGLLSTYTTVDGNITPVFTFLIKKGSISGIRLQCPVYQSSQNMQLISYNPSTESLLADESIGVEHLSPALRIKLGFN